MTGWARWSSLTVLEGRRESGAKRRIMDLDVFCRHRPLQLSDGTIEGVKVDKGLKSQLAAADAELRAHMASWEYAFAMGSARDGGRSHPMHAATHARTDALVRRYRDLQALVAEHDVS